MITVHELARAYDDALMLRLGLGQGMDAGMLEWIEQFRVDGEYQVAGRTIWNRRPADAYGGNIAWHEDVEPGYLIGIPQNYRRPPGMYYRVPAQGTMPEVVVLRREETSVFWS